MSELIVKSLTKKYPGGTLAVDAVSFEVHEGESVAVFGLDKSGKSSLLRMIAGLEEATSGQVLLDGKDITDASTKERDMAFVFQSVSLDNSNTVFDNLAYGLKLRKADPAVIDVKVKAVAEILGLSDDLGRKPKALSPEKRRLIAFGRTLVRDPKVFIFDEALSGLDGALRTSVLSLITGLQVRLKATYLYATDDIREALTVGDRVAILREGKLVQIDTPENICNAPADDYVKTVLGLYDGE